MNLTFIILLSSIFIVLIIGYGTFLFLKLKEKKYIKEYQEKNVETNINDETQNILLVELKDDFVEKIQTNEWVKEELSFIINTINRNSYSNNLFIEKEGLATLVAKEHLNMSNFYLYEKYLNKEQYQENIQKLDIKNESSVELIHELKENHKIWDFVFINDFSLNLEINELFDLVYKKIRTNGMIIIKDIQNKKEHKKLLAHLNFTKIRYEENIIRSSFLIIVK